MSVATASVARPAGSALRGIGLHLRGRRAGAALAGLVGTAVAARGLVALLPELTQTTLTVIAPLLAASFLGPPLAGADPELEHTAPRLTPRFRTSHLLLGVVGATTVLAVTSIGPLSTAGAEAAGRNLLGFTGLTALSATVAGARLAWLAPSAFGMVAVSAGVQTEPIQAVLAWPAQEPGMAPTLVALGLAIVGAAAYARQATRGRL